MQMTISMGDLYASVQNNVTTVLTLDITDTSATIAVADASKFPPRGVFSIGYEVIRYTSIQSGNVFLGCTRGFGLNTTAVPHSAGDTVELRWVAEHHNSVAQAIVDIETTLGASITGAYTNVSDRLVSFEATSGLSYPVSPAHGAMHYNLGWFIYNTITSSWVPVNSSGSTVSVGDYWSLDTSGISIVYPTTASMAKANQAVLLDPGSLRDSLNSLSGFGAIGRDDGFLTYKTGADALVQIVDDDRLVAPRIAGLGIDYPEENKISAMTVIPTGPRNISNVFMVIAGSSCSCTLTLCKLIPETAVVSYSIMTTISATVVSSTESVVLSQQALGDWNDSLYTISSGDILFAKVVTTSGTPGRVVLTVEAPYYPLGIVVGNEWQNTTNTGDEIISIETGTPVQEVN